MTFQQICKDVHMVKTNGQQVFIESRNRPLPRRNTSAGNMKAQLADERSKNVDDDDDDGERGTYVSVPLMFVQVQQE